MRRITIGIALVCSALMIASGSASANGGPHAKVTPRRGLAGGQTVTVTWGAFPKLRRGQIWVDECSPNWQALGYQTQCDGTGAAEVSVKNERNGTAQLQVIKGELETAGGDPIVDCGDSRSTNNCVLVIGAFANESDVLRGPLALTIKFAQ
jgi:hypothetical protein